MLKHYSYSNLKISKNYLYEIFAYLMVCLLFTFNIKNSFFWDTVQLGSKHAHYYLNSNFSELILPTNIDSGHIPTFGIYLALIWKFINKSIIVSHLAILPFIIGIVYQLKLVLKKLVPERYNGIALVLVLLDSTLLSQMTMISPDIILCFLFLYAINAIIDNRKSTLTFLILALFLTSMRGMMISLCLLIFDIYLNTSITKDFKKSISELLKRSLIYLPAFLIFIAFSIYHYSETGWIGYHKNSPWATSFEKVDFLGFIMNIIRLGYRLIEFGRFGVWIVLIVLTISFFKRLHYKKEIRLLLVLLSAFLFIFPLNMLWAKGLMLPRYLIPLYLCVSIFCVKLLFTLPIKQQIRNIFTSIWITGFILGGFNIFPKMKSPQWESTLAHLPYFKLRHKAIEYLNNERINIRDVGTFFPNIESLETIDLNEDYREFKEFNGINKYILISNVYNIKDANLEIIKAKYKILTRYEDRGVFVEIHKKIRK